MQLTGHAGPCLFHTSGECVPAPEEKNLTTYGAADIMARLLNGDATARITHLYFRYQNTNGSVSVTPTITRGTSRADFAAITGAGPTYEDYLRVPLVADGRLFRYPPDTTSYRGNAVYFVANSATSSLTGESPAHNYFAASGPQGPSKVFAVYLINAPVIDDPTRDRVFAGLTYATPQQFLPNSYPGAYWVMRLS